MSSGGRERRQALIDRLIRAFPIESKPTKIDGSAYSKDELAEQKRYEGLAWTEVTADFLSQTTDAIFLMREEAQRYFVPRLLRAALIANDRDICGIGWLNVSFDEDNMKWRGKKNHILCGTYSQEQLDVLLDCVRWLAEDEHSISTESLANAERVVAELKQRK